MRKLVESTFVTLDGVMGNPQDWGSEYWDDEHGSYAHKMLFGADALVLGRETYEGFSQAWPLRSGDEYTDRINSMPKHVASTTLTDLTWNAEVLEGDAIEAVRALKEQDGQGLLKFGTGDFSKALFENGLVDEFHFWMFPVIAGSGQRLFDGLDLTHLNLVDSTAFESGIVVHVLAPK
jgi:dihydrofolate reductase